MAKYENPENYPIALIKVKKMAGAPTLIISDPPEAEERLDGEPIEHIPDSTPTIPAVRTVVPCTGCDKDFERDPNCPQCGGQRIKETMQKVEL
jgi:hypothetical protein